VGFGRIGQAVAARARAFGMQVIFHDPAYPESADARDLDDLLRESDVVSLHCPLTEGTRHLMNAARLGLMRPGALLLNMARGKVMDETALVDALRSGQLGGAGLDVFEDEPKVHPELMKMPNVVLAPHVGGGTRESRQAARLSVATDLSRVLKGLDPLHAINRPR
jgi:glyoxylate reductase